MGFMNPNSSSPFYFLFSIMQMPWALQRCVFPDPQWICLFQDHGKYCSYYFGLSVMNPKAMSWLNRSKVEPYYLGIIPHYMHDAGLVKLVTIDIFDMVDELAT